jgi:hypothetical protein
LQIAAFSEIVVLQETFLSSADSLVDETEDSRFGNGNFFETVMPKLVPPTIGRPAT